MTRLVRWLRRIWRLLQLILAAIAAHGGAPPATPPAPAPTPTPTTAPVPAQPAPGTTGSPHVIGTCHTGQDGNSGRWFAVCMVDGGTYTLPKVFGSRKEARAAIKAFRDAA